MRTYSAISTSGEAAVFAASGKTYEFLGFRRAYRVVAPETTLTSMLDRRVVPPWGVHGGRDGLPYRITLNPGTPGARDIGGKVSVRLTRGDLLLIETCGGRICLSYRRAVPPRPFGPTITYPVGRKDALAPWEVVVTPDAKGRGWIVWRDGSHADGGGVVWAQPLGAGG